EKVSDADWIQIAAELGDHDRAAAGCRGKCEVAGRDARLDGSPADRSERRLQKLARTTRRYLHSRAPPSLGAQLTEAARRLRLVLRRLHVIYRLTHGTGVEDHQLQRVSRYSCACLRLISLLL